MQRFWHACITRVLVYPIGKFEEQYQGLLFTPSPLPLPLPLLSRACILLSLVCMSALKLVFGRPFMPFFRQYGIWWCSSARNLLGKGVRNVSLRACVGVCLPPPLPQCHSLSLSLSLSLPLPLSLCLPLCLFLYLSLSLTHTHTHTHYVCVSVGVCRFCLHKLNFPHFISLVSLFFYEMR